MRTTIIIAAIIIASAINTEYTLRQYFALIIIIAGGFSGDVFDYLNRKF